MTAKEYAIGCHENTNHLYGNVHPYSYHLQMVGAAASLFHHLIPSQDLDTVYAACWCHDVIEDCRQTYNDVLKATNKEVAEIVYALTNEKGKNRSERGNDKYYKGIRETKYASFVKLCDRIADVTYSKDTNSSMLEMYRKENDKFCESVGNEYPEMIEHLKYLLSQ